MKKMAILSMLFICFAFVSATVADTKADVEITAPDASNVTIKNDTKQDLYIHTGQAHVKLSRGGTTSVGCDAGRKISLSDRNKATKLLFKIESSMCGKTVLLSKYL